MKKKLLLFLVIISMTASYGQKVSTQVPVRKNVKALTTTVQPQKAPQKAKLISLNKKSKHVTREVRLSASARVQFVKLVNGNSLKRIVRTNAGRILRNKVISPRMAFKAASDTTFFESFEGWDGTTADWIPTTWTELNKTGNKYASTDDANITWAVSEGLLNSASDGSYMAAVDYSTDKDQDEWLVSPAFTPATGDYFFFDLWYSPIWMYLNMETFTYDFTKPRATMQVQISEDNGTTWTKIWDAHNYVSNYTVDNIEQYSDDWNTFKLSMDKYVGKSVKIAFRYVGKDANMMCVDNVSIRQRKAEALYARPQGFFFLGLTPDWSNTAADQLLGSAYDKAKWYNYSNFDSEAFTWTFPDKVTENATFTSAETNPEVEYPFGTYNVPSLKATAGNSQSTYTWGTSENGAYFSTGGNATYDWGTVGAGNYDLTKGVVAWSFADNDYCFGTGPDKKVDAVVNYFEKPLHPYTLDSVWINLGEFSAPAGTEFKLIIRRIDSDGYLVDTLATASCTTENVLTTDGVYSMIFKGFKTIDPETGLEVENDYIDISDAVMMEMNGFNIPNVTLSTASQRETGLEANAYVYLNETDENGAAVRNLYNSAEYIGDYTSLCFNLGITYSFLFADSNEFKAPVSGGSKTFNVTSYYSPDMWWTATDLPTWLKEETTFDEKTWATTLKLTAEALPAGVTERNAEITVNTFGSSMKISVSQNGASGIKDASQNRSSVKTIASAFVLSYPSDFKSASLCNASGQVIRKYSLPTDGTLTINTLQLPKGIYILKLEGNGVETFKVMR